jgi:hypothetical protein
VKRREVIALVGAATALGGTAVFAQKRPKIVAALLQGGAYRVGFDGLKQVLETEAPRDSIHLLVREGGGDIETIKSAAQDFEQSGVDVLVTFATKGVHRIGGRASASR